MPDEFYLCQPKELGGGVPSCAACCGIYNYHGHTREMVTAILRRQTELMAGWDGSEVDIERIRAEVENNRPPVRFEVIYNCPFSGFLDREQTRVGCLLHPLHIGRDLRDFCRYGHRTCGEARCASYTYFDEPEARAVMVAAGDWYLYGQNINDPDLVKDFFEMVEMKLLHPVDPNRVASDPDLARAFADYLSLRETWPFATDPGRQGKYFFVGKNYNIFFINYRALGVKEPRHNDIIVALGSVIDTREKLERAIEIIDEKIDNFARIYESGKERGLAE